MRLGHGRQQQIINPLPQRTDLSSASRYFASLPGSRASHSGSRQQEQHGGNDEI
jgi:hypothetical protein